MAMLRFYWRVLRRVPGVLVTASGIVTALVFVVALAAVLVFADKDTAQDVLGFHGYSPVWAAVPCGLIVAFLLAKANYEEADQLAKRTNAITPATTQIAAQNVAQGGNVINFNNSTINFVLRQQPPEPPPQGPPGPRT